jgi:hypothetical protein
MGMTTLEFPAQRPLLHSGGEMAASASRTVIAARRAITAMNSADVAREST